MKKQFVSLEASLVQEFFIKKYPQVLHEYLAPTRLSTHRIFILHGGTGYACIDNRCFSLDRSQIILMASGQLVFFSDDARLNGYELAFNNAFWEKAPKSASNCKSVLFDQTAINQCLPLTAQEADELFFLFHTLEMEFQKQDYINKTDALAAYLKIIMIKIANINYSLAERYNDHDRQIYTQFLELVATYYPTLREVSAYAKKLHITNRQLGDICKKQSGNSPKQLITQQLINEAKRLLHFSAMPIKEIAFSLHFSTAEQFSHFFKKQTSFSPQHYRDQYVKNDR